jgi:polar amino acid transport system ATP-binding protein
MTSLLRLDNIHKSFGETSVLSGISMDVSHGEVVALIGASGSGKSTLLRCINLLEQIDDGQIWLSGDDITDPRANPDAIRARIGVVFQQFNLFPHLSVLHNITLSLIQVKKMKKSEARDHAHQLLAHVGLGDKANWYPDRLSGGQQQRVALVRAIACKPEVLLLDEITSALDPELVDEVLELVRTLKEEGTTIVMATHEMAFARDVADRVFFISGGVIVEGGPAVDVLQNPQDARTQAFLHRFRGQ